MKWSGEELALIEGYFKSSVTRMTLYQRLHKLNPQRTYEAISKQISRMRLDGWLQNKEAALKKLKVGYLDIEATNLNGNFGYIISWCIKEDGKEQYNSGLIKKSEIFNYMFDKRLVEELLDAFNNYDVLYTHYGSDRRFDLPFIRTRAYANGLEHKLPGYMDKFIMDTYPIARNKLKLHSNRLGVIADILGITDVKKTQLSPKIWMLASAGHPKALAYIQDHNKKDVLLLQKVHQKLRIIESQNFRSM